MDKNTNLTNLAVTAVTRADAAGNVKKAGAAASGQPGQPPALPNFAVLARRIFGNWPLIVGALVIGAPISLKLVKGKMPVYKSEGTLIFRGGVNGDPSLESLKSLGTRMKETSLATSTLKRVVDDLRLAPHATETGNYEGIVASLRPRIETKPKTPDTFTVTFDDSSPEDAQRFTQRLCEVMMEENMKSRQDRAKDSIDFLESEKKRADDDLGKSEKERTLFMSLHPEFASDGKDGTTIRAEQKASASQKKKAAGNAMRVRRAAGASNIAPPTPGFGPSAPAAAGAPAVDPVLVAARSQARTEVAAAKKQLAEKSINLTEQHPDVRAAAARVAAAEAALEQAEAAIAAAQPNDPAPAPAPIAASPDDPYDSPSATPTAAPAPKPVVAGDATVDKPKAKPRLTEDGEPIAVEIEAEWSRITRDVSEAKARRGQLEGRLFQAEISANSEVSGYGSQMVMPEPATRGTAATTTNPKLLRLAGMGAALVVGILLAAARGILLDDRLFDASEIEALGLAPLLGSVPKAKVEKKKKQSFLGRLRG